MGGAKAPLWGFTDNPSMAVSVRSCISPKQNKAKKEGDWRVQAGQAKAREAFSYLPHWTARGPFTSVSPEHGPAPGWGMCREDANPGPRGTRQKPGPGMAEGGAIQYDLTKLDVLEDNR